MTTNVSIVADIGGTNTRVALADGDRVRDDSIQRFTNAEYLGLAEILIRYLSERPGVTPNAACAAIAGPVQNGTGTLTNLNWTVDDALLKQATGAGITSVINDLQAQGHALEHLSSDKIRTIVGGVEADTTAARLVVGVGTGFNAAPVFHAGSKTLVAPAEAGHADLPTPSEEMRTFAKHFETKNGHCAIEDMISGRGLGHVYTWLSGKTLAPAKIMEACAEGSDENATNAVGAFCRAFGSVCGNIALNILPFGGIYLVGGVSSAVAPYLEKHGFIEAFHQKGRFTEFMQQFPVYVVEDDYAALEGMAALLNEMQNSPVTRS